MVHLLGFGIGITSGFATMGIVGFEGRFDYTANGNVVNLASRLCDHANDEQILVSQRVLIEVEEYVASTTVDNLRLKGVSNPVVAHNIDALLAAD